ncbi:transcriptional regulatory protein [Mycobacterium ulcerans str. Harvey]|uniref:Transcriptional regulatory protein n=1 Tax=Mycobacterium ulcerans str. Harvey TaxID=1299332 RepID=A0ABN0QQ82_MYCUL|nr:transcriptional regulatory protein [Mycobacterium ulcerans str. Harvey]
MLVAVGASRSLEDGTAAVLNAGVDGFVVYSVRDDDPYLQVVLQRRLPVVVVDQPKELAGVSRVGIDDRAAMRKIADYVLSLGHRQIGLLTMRLGRTGAKIWSMPSGSSRRLSMCSVSASRACGRR